MLWSSKHQIVRKINLPAPRNSFPNSFTRPPTIYPRWATVRTGHWRLNWYALFSQFPHALEYVIETEPLDLIPSDEGVTLRLACSQHKHRELADTIHAHAKYTADIVDVSERAGRSGECVQSSQSVTHSLIKPKHSIAKRAVWEEEKSRMNFGRQTTNQKPRSEW